MSFFGKIFGKKEEVPSTTEAIQNLLETEKILIKKQEHLEHKIEQELQTAKKQSVNKNKRAAIQALKKKKRFEKQLQQIDGTLSTLEMQREALEGANTNTAVLTNMKNAADALKAAHKHMDVDKVHDMMDDIAEQQDLAREISEAISTPMGGYDIDDDELEKELEELEQEELDKELLNVDKTAHELPDVPSGDIKQPNVADRETKKVAAKSVEEEDDDMKMLSAWAS
ncbi:charged multivesicular body protein 4b-like [Contarinia nasturtii]|uniref:charged multivesicular body protein 4b-like n=1 Tax=Contarinia nasturtii TaxID=265458 RepID=UPI0012D417B1|nr:charged multivesicular body protein 4b-like [Contarinia nasturtii]